MGEAEVRAGMEFLEALAREGRVLDATELRVEAVAAGIALDVLWEAARRVGGVPGWASTVPWVER